MNVLWLDKSHFDAFTFVAANPDSRNYPLSIIVKVQVEIKDEEDEKRMPQAEVYKIELLVMNGVIHESKDENGSNENESEDQEDEDGPQRIQLTTRTGRSATKNLASGINKNRVSNRKLCCDYKANMF